MSRPQFLVLPPIRAAAGVGPAVPGAASAAMMLLLLGAGLHLFVGLQPQGFLASGALADADGWARSQRVLDLWQGAGWYDGTAPRLNAPFGLSLHWTRPLDLLILLPAMAMRALAGLPQREAVLLSGALLSPVLHLGCAFAAQWAARPLWPRDGAMLAGMLVLLHPVALGYSMFGRADHHTLLLLADLLALGAGLRAVLDPADRGAAWLAGLSAGAGVWVGPEALLAAGPVLAGFGLAWAFEFRSPGGMAGQGRRAGLGLALVAVAAIALERPPAAWLDGEYDAVSAQHVLMGLLAAAGFTLAGAVPCGAARRLAAGTGLAGLAALLLLACYPQALRASLAGADAAAARLFLPMVQEMQGFDPHRLAGWLELPDLLGGGVLAPLALGLAWRGWRRSGRLAAAAPLGIAFLGCLAAALLHRRFALDLAAPAALLAAGLPGLLERAGRPLVARLALLAMAGLPIATGTLRQVLPGAEDPAAMRRVACDGPALIEALRGARAGFPATASDPVLLASSIGAGPVLAWSTPWRLVASPYHRGGAAFADTATFFLGADPAAARAVAERRQVALVLLCPPETGETFPPGSLGARLAAGDPPDWLAPLPPPGGAGTPRLFLRR